MQSVFDSLSSPLQIYRMKNILYSISCFKKRRVENRKACKMKKNCPFNMKIIGAILRWWVFRISMHPSLRTWVDKIMSTLRGTDRRTGWNRYTVYQQNFVFGVYKNQGRGRVFKMVDDPIARPFIYHSGCAYRLCAIALLHTRLKSFHKTNPYYPR